MTLPQPSYSMPKTALRQHMRAETEQMTFLRYWHVNDDEDAKFTFIFLHVRSAVLIVLDERTDCLCLLFVWSSK